MLSKYNSFCVKCKHEIRIGEEITKDRGLDRWVHQACPSSLESVLAKNSQPEKVAEEQNMIGSMDFEPSPYQVAIFDAIQDDNYGNIVVEAVAGSGKTTTIVKALELTPKDAYVAFLAFNRHIAKELERRVPEHVHVSTLHSLGLSIIRKLDVPVKVNTDKVSQIMDEFWPIGKDVEPSVKFQNKSYRSHMRKLVSLSKATMIDYHSKKEVNGMLEHYGIDLNGEGKEVLKKLPYVMKKCLENLEEIDFDDMIWLPLVHKRLRLHFDKFDYLFVDEAQDLNTAQIEFVMKLKSATGRVVAVGDRKQSLYGFRGADVEAIPRLINMLDAKVLPLSISYRCPTEVVNLAQEIVPQIEASSFAKEGKIRRIDNINLVSEVNSGDMVVCRTNAPLVAPAYECIRRGKKAIIRGRDIGKQLVNFVNKFEAAHLADLEIKMAEFTAKEVERLNNRGKELAADMVLDKYETIKSVSNECKTVEELIGKLLMLFDDSNVGVVFSSVHRAKGLESDKVYILKEELMPHPKANPFNWEMEQEYNLKYVAYTRSKNELIFVNS